MAIVNVGLAAAKNQMIVTFDGKDLPEREMDLAINAPGIPKLARGKVNSKEAIRISKNKFLVTIN